MNLEVSSVNAEQAIIELVTIELILKQNLFQKTVKYIVIITE